VLAIPLFAFTQADAREYPPANSPNIRCRYSRAIDRQRSDCCTADVARKRVCGAALHNIVDSVVNSYDGEVSRLTQEKLVNYIRLLASTGKTDEQLLAFGTAYLREILKPDPRYSGW
jgi:hypothetical protein